ncbi:regulator of G-protein signaling 20 isoform X2 [Alosa alosa]|uniref:regulator of G-protein signaling 20 isoform X2 n=1 Tax=Alosa sapidissima TaxID=34773 RepID=UPI001C086BE3|nr:regulator of G-protein signaling 20 isoform X2 [Alosa sapidissima]XP_048120846.1 regulator of G-protein signaling 20 isoform X2 [Alosa alosa]
MLCTRIVRCWAVRPSCLLRLRVPYVPSLMWGRIQRILLACRHGDGYSAQGSHAHENERDLSFQPMGSERMEMRKRQMSVQQEPVAGGTAPTQPEQPDQGARGSNACCFCWCCCCSCSWNEDREERNRRDSYHTKTEETEDCEESLKPTMEEVRAWGQSFDKLMHCPSGRNAFRQFLRTEFSEENMLFWLACEEFCKEANKGNVEEKARLIYEDYISILSPKEVSLDSRVRDVINRNMLEPNLHTFDDAQLQIYTLMQRDSYPRFLNSALYKDLVQTLSEQSPES